MYGCFTLPPPPYHPLFYHSFRTSFYSLGAELAKAVSKYNTFRPHFALDGLTPLADLHSIPKETQRESHFT